MLLKVEYLNRWSHALLSIDLLCGRPGVVSTCSTNITNYLNDLLMVKSEPLSCFTDTVENLIKLSRHLLKTSSTSFAGSQKKWLSSEHKQNQITCTMLPNCRHQSSGNLKGQTKHLRKNSTNDIQWSNTFGEPPEPWNKTALGRDSLNGEHEEFLNFVCVQVQGMLTCQPRPPDISLMFRSIEHLCTSKERSRHPPHPTHTVIPIMWTSPFPPKATYATANVPCAAQVRAMFITRSRTLKTKQMICVCSALQP